MGAIKQLDSEAAALIEAEQVIVNIWSAVKETLENSLDAEAKNISNYLPN